jgi:uncharacterized membrane protein YsdA (DUF1294 family)
MSSICFVAYGWDKRRAELERSRISEARLHLFELLGGWPGAFVAQRYFRHKNRKVAYQVRYWLMVAVNLACLVGFFYARSKWYA